MVASVGMPPSIRSRGRRSLHDTIFATPAGIFRAAGDEHPELRRHDVQPLALVLPDPVQFALTAGAGPAVDIDDDLDPWQMRRQTSRGWCVASRPARLAQSEPTDLLSPHRSPPFARVFETEQHLIFGKGLGPAAKTVAAAFL